MHPVGMTNSPLAHALRLAARARGLASNAAVHRVTGVAESTLTRIMNGHPARGDTLLKLEIGLGLEDGTLLGVVDGYFDPEDVRVRLLRDWSPTSEVIEVSEDRLAALDKVAGRELTDEQRFRALRAIDRALG